MLLDTVLHDPSTGQPFECNVAHEWVDMHDSDPEADRKELRILYITVRVHSGEDKAHTSVYIYHHTWGLGSTLPENYRFVLLVNEAISAIIDKLCRK